MTDVDLLQQLKAVAPYRYLRVTRLSTSAYDKGFGVGLTGLENAANPYRQKHLPNFARGDNDPRYAWDMGLMDGLRVLKMMNGEHPYNMTGREIDILAAQGTTETAGRGDAQKASAE